VSYRTESVARNGIGYGPRHRAFWGWVVLSVEAILALADRPGAVVGLDDEAGAEIATAHQPGATITLTDEPEATL
jgi:hypothetical protein